MSDEIKVFVSKDQDVVLARQEGRSLAERLGFSKVDATLIATAISEVTRNVVQYAGEGEVVIEPFDAGGRTGVRIEIRDSGPGIPSVERALQGEHPSGGRAGLGLPGARLLMDELVIDSEPGAGTVVTMIKWRGEFP
jgi:anti-sigma regulatory factor (Ser/Thr protein kinase)